MPQAVQAHEAFDLVRSSQIDSLNLEVQEFRHRETGAQHYHLAADNTENVFLVALRTVPEDSTGVAHILEHTVLCGSERYPVRDPFFLMLRRSLNTFMNAFTSSDWTAYPFASQNRKDFQNLLDVYLDAVFFSTLDPLDFAQEGHRIEFADPGDPQSPLVYKGVVFNEMKGAMSSVTSTLWQTLCEHLFPSTTYHYNSGGEPACIPDLDYDQLRHFYETHYHPGNAVFMTFGDIPAHEHQKAFQERALARFQALDKRIEVPLEQRFEEPRQVEAPYAFDEQGSLDNRTHILVGWLLGESTNLEKMLEAQLLSSVLLDNSASPLLRALETTSLGQSPSPLCGLEESMREMVFVCGLEGSERDRAEDVEELVLGVVQEVCDKGVDRDRLEAVLHQLELHQREISGDSYPYGLQLILTALGYATHYADPISALDLDPVIATLRERIQDPDYIGRLARECLLDNPHRLRLVMYPDPQLSARRSEEERQRLEAIGKQLGDAERESILKRAEALSARQAQEDDDSILPKVGLDDVPAQIPDLTPRRTDEAGYPCTLYAQGTNGLVYQQLLSPLPALPDHLLDQLSYYSNVLTEVGLGNEDYLAVQDRQAATVGSINCFTSMRGMPGNQQDSRAYSVLSSKALARNHEAQTRLMRDTIEQVRFDEHGRIRELVAQQRARREQAVTGNGHGLAMAAACAGMSPVAALNHRLSGLEGIRSCKALDKSLNDADSLAAFCDDLGTIHDHITAMPRELLVIADDEHLDAIVQAAGNTWTDSSTSETGNEYATSPVSQITREIWVANTQVNFCAKAYPTVPAGHPDAPALTVLGGFLRNGFLHTAIREKGGAYGGGASQDSNIGAFRFYSYRDPRLLETLEDFDASIRWLLSSKLGEDELEQAILGVVSTLDKPSSPAGEAKQHFHNSLFGRTHEQREAFRRGVLSVSTEELRAVAERWLVPDRASVAVITGRDKYEAVSDHFTDVTLQTL